MDIDFEFESNLFTAGAHRFDDENLNTESYLNDCIIDDKYIVQMNKSHNERPKFL